MAKGRFPEFYVVGAAKSGTTSLWYYLLQHPQLFLVAYERYKELGFFASDHGIDSEEDYKLFFEEATEKQLIGEVCNSYLTDKESPALIKQQVPNARIIIVLRNPIDRAFSLFNWMKTEGYENISTFEEALNNEEKRSKDDSFRQNNPHGNAWHYKYFESGLYYGQVKRYLDVFGKDNCLILLFDDLKQDPVGISQKCYEFLGVDAGFSPTTGVLNEAREPGSQKLQYLIRHVIPKYRDKLRLPKGMLGAVPGKILKMNQKKSTQRKLDNQTRKILARRYAEDVKATAELIHRNLDHWIEEK